MSLSSKTNLIIATCMIVSLSLPLCVSAITSTDWEQVLLSDKSDFDIKCKYRADIESKIAPWKTWFTSTQSKRIGYTPDSIGHVNIFIMSNNKSIMRFETKEGSLMREWAVLKLEKNCSPAVVEQNRGARKDNYITVMNHEPDKAESYN